MRLPALAKLAVSGLVYIYTVKLIATLYQGVFKSTAVITLVVGLNILAGLAQVLFFIALYRQFVPPGKPVLRVTGSLAVVGSILGLLPKLLALAVLLQPPPLFVFIRHGTYISAFCPWLMAVLLLTFSLTSLFDSGFRQKKHLKRAFAAGAAGWFIMAVAQSLVIVNYLTYGRLITLAGLFAAGPIVFVTASSLASLNLGVFYLTFAFRH